jgi:hypothetical protein
LHHRENAPKQDFPVPINTERSPTTALFGLRLMG